MAEEEKKAKKAAPKKTEAKAAAPKKTAKAPAAAAKKTVAPKAASLATGKAIRVTQIASPIGRHPDQRKTLIGLGLNKIRRSKVLQDTPAIRGMITKVHHLVKIEDAA